MPPVCFVADSMLEKLARYLRCAGADVHSDRNASTATLIERANRDNRHFLTRNRHLVHHHPLAAHQVLLESDDPVEQFHQLLAAGLVDTSRLFSRCIRCNLPLEAIEREAIQDRVPPGVFEAYRRFFSCPSCTTIFWLGSHVRNTCRKLGLPDASERSEAV